MKWYYIDEEEWVRGPFDDDQMLEWFLEGWFRMETLVREQHSNKYVPLREIILNLQRVPFVKTTRSGSVTSSESGSTTSDISSTPFSERMSYKFDKILNLSREEQRPKRGDSNRSPSTCSDDSSKCCLHIGNLQSDIKVLDLQRAFYKFGSLSRVWVARNPPGYGFVEFYEMESGLRALERMDGVSIKESKICVNLARTERASKRNSADGKFKSRCASRSVESDCSESSTIKEDWEEESLVVKGRVINSKREVDIVNKKERGNIAVKSVTKKNNNLVDEEWWG